MHLHTLAVCLYVAGVWTRNGHLLVHSCIILLWARLQYAIAGLNFSMCRFSVQHLTVVDAGRFKMGLWGGLAHAALDTYLLRGNAPWTLRHRYTYMAVSTPAQCPCAGSLHTCLCNCCHVLSHLSCPTLLQDPQIVELYNCQRLLDLLQTLGASAPPPPPTHLNLTAPPVLL